MRVEMEMKKKWKRRWKWARRLREYISGPGKAIPHVPIGRRREEVSDRTATVGPQGGKARTKPGRVVPTRKQKKRLDWLFAVHSSPRRPSPPNGPSVVRSEEACDLRRARERW